MFSGFGCTPTSHPDLNQVDVISHAQPPASRQTGTAQTDDIPADMAVEESYSSAKFNQWGDIFLKIYPSGEGVDIEATKWWQTRSLNAFRSLNDFGFVLDAVHEYNMPKLEGAKISLEVGVEFLLFTHMAVFPWSGQSEEFAGLTMFNSIKMFMVNPETFESTGWKQIYDFSKDKSGEQKWMVDLVYADSILGSMLNFGENKLEEAITNVENGDWTVKTQGDKVYICFGPQWKESEKVDAEEYFGTTIWEGTQKDARLEDARAAVETARSDCSACIPSEDEIARIVTMMEATEQPNIFEDENWSKLEIPEPKIPDYVVYHLLQMDGGFARSAALRLGQARRTSGGTRTPPDCSADGVCNTRCAPGRDPDCAGTPPPPPPPPPPPEIPIGISNPYGHNQPS